MGLNQIRSGVGWLIHTDAGLRLRIALGVAIFLSLALADLAKNRARATRWREYAFLPACVGVAMVYGAINDLITSCISWEYFYYGKDLMSVLGPRLPPDPHALAIAAAVVGIKATWTAGLIVGVVILIANNPGKLPRIGYRKLLSYIPGVFLLCALCGVLLGIAGYQGWLIRLNSDFADLVRDNEFRPYRFMAVFGVHLGGYVGGAAGSVWAAMAIGRSRKRAQAIKPHQAIHLA